jgi:hypothetical protein
MAGLTRSTRCSAEPALGPDRGRGGAPCRPALDSRVVHGGFPSPRRPPRRRRCRLTRCSLPWRPLPSAGGGTTGMRPADITRSTTPTRGGTGGQEARAGRSAATDCRCPTWRAWGLLSTASASRPRPAPSLWPHSTRAYPGGVAGGGFGRRPAGERRGPGCGSSLKLGGCESGRETNVRKRPHQPDFRRQSSSPPPENAGRTARRQARAHRAGHGLIYDLLGPAGIAWHVPPPPGILICD